MIKKRLNDGICNPGYEVKKEGRRNRKEGRKEGKTKKFTKTI